MEPCHQNDPQRTFNVPTNQLADTDRPFFFFSPEVNAVRPRGATLARLSAA